jgi:hypothetical protein
MTDEQSTSADALVARAIESVLHAMPTGPVDETPADLAKYQPWADTGAPTGKNKRPLDALLAELRDRVEAEPDALAAQPGGKRPGLAYFDRFGGPRREGAPAPGAGKRRRRGRGNAGGGEGVAAGAPTREPGRGGPGRPPARSGQPPRDQGSPRPPKDAGAQAGQRPAGTEGSRRRRRRRGGRSGPGGGQAGGRGGQGGGAA